MKVRDDKSLITSFLVGFVLSKLLTHLTYFLVISFTINCEGLSYALAQTSSQQPVQYQAIQLNDVQSSFNFDGNSYVFHETASFLKLSDIEKLIESGKILNFKSSSNHVSIGNRDKGTWIVFPIVNKSKREIWSVNLGGLIDGRFSAFKDIILYNMSMKEYIVNTQM